MGLSFGGTLVEAINCRTGLKFNFFNQLTGRSAWGGEQALMTASAGCLPKLSTKEKIKKFQ
jgi:hypothetical protein